MKVQCGRTCWQVIVRAAAARRFRAALTKEKNEGKREMKAISKVMAVGLVMMVTAAGALAAEAEVTLSADVASAYIFRGVTFNDGVVLQPGMEAAIGAFTVGVWGNLDLDDYNGALEKNQFSELDLYASYALPVEFMDISLDYCEYTYPGAEGEADREIALSYGLALPLSPSLMVAYGVDGGIEKSLYAELGAGHELQLSEMVALDAGATVGYLDPDEGESGFSHFTASLGLSMGPFSASVTYVGQIDDDVLPDGEGAYDVEVYGMLGVAGTF